MKNVSRYGMKRLILKTAAITLAAIILLGALLLLILSLAAPRVMMDFTASMGMGSVSGHFAYKEYERSGDLDCLARSFLIAEGDGDDETALRRWDELYGSDGFSAYCERTAPEGEGVPAYRYRDYLSGTAARVMYRLSDSNEEKAAALAFALSETQQIFPAGNPVVALAAEATERGDGGFLEEIRAALLNSDFEHNDDYLRLAGSTEGEI